MEDNQKNVQNEVHNVEQKVNENKPQKSGKGKTIVLMIILLILVLAIGLCGGYWLSNKNSENSNNGNEKKTEQSVENKNENNTSKKIDESKPWVYDAEYLGNRENKKLTMSYVGKSYTAKDNLVVPFININSDAAQKANEEIRAFYEEYYKEFGSEIVWSDGTIDEQVYNYRELKYKVFEIENIVSIVIYKTTGAYDFSTGIVTYSFNLDTLDLMTLEDAAKFCGFSSKEDLIDKSNIAINNDDEMSGLEWDDKRFIIDLNKKINIVVPGPGPSDSLFVVDSNVVEVSDKKSNDVTGKEPLQTKDSTSDDKRSEANQTGKTTTTTSEYSKLNGTYTRKDESEMSSGTLVISNASESSLSFKINATKVHPNENETVQEAIDRGAINLGNLEGIAYKIDENTWKYQDNSEMAKEFGGYAVTLKLENNNSFTFNEIYDETKNFTGLYCGGGVHLDGNYTK